MKATELRIGNLFKRINADEILAVTGVYMAYSGLRIRFVAGNSNEHEDQDFTEELLEPIPLTKEWLNLFGIKTSPIYNVSTISEGMEIDMEYKELFLWSGMGGSDDYGYSAPCEYVHQLQNLYFDLTGKELTLTDS